MTKQAFSLLEILIVTAIICIIVALTFPVLRQPVSRAKEIHCLNSMKQVWTAGQLYSADHNSLPPNSGLEDAWKPYFSRDLVLGCSAAATAVPMQERLITGDYIVWLNYLALDPELVKCAEIRGPAFPVVLDTNHLLTLAGKGAGYKVLLLIRMDGSAHRISREKIDANAKEGVFGDPNRLPCPFLTSPYGNL